MILLLSLVACGPYTFSDDTGGKDSTDDGCVARSKIDASSDKYGYAYIPVEVENGDESFQVVARRDSNAMPIDYIVDPNENVVLTYEDWYSTESLTGAFFLSSEASVVNYPIRAGDQPLTKGTWQVLVGTYSNSGTVQTNQDVGGTVIRRGCQENKATLPINVVYAGGLDKDSVVSSAVERAVDRWDEIYGSMNVSLEVEYNAVDWNADVPAPAYASDKYESLYDGVGADGGVLVVGDTVDNEMGLYGEAGGIPGAMDATPYASVAVSWLMHAGSNGTFNDAEIELFAETMAHETGHYLGLFHPVESTYDYWDALDDTTRCSSASNCESKLGTNMMFPYPICGSSSCTQQDDITSDQQTVARNWVGVR